MVEGKGSMAVRVHDDADVPMHQVDRALRIELRFADAQPRILDVEHAGLLS
jgi:hypothetical protein